MGSFSGPGVCIEFVDVSTLMSIGLDVMWLGQSKVPLSDLMLVVERARWAVGSISAWGREG